LKIVGVVGYTDSGKTTLIRALARELTAQGHRVAVVKHTSHHIDVPGKDTAVLGEVADQVAIIAPQESAVFWKRPLGLEDVLAHIEADLVLVEGFKGARGYPKIVCLRGMLDDADLFDGTIVAAVGPAEYAPDGVPLFDRNAVDAIAELVETIWLRLGAGLR
jgi:molybdopterin-guanine dinucleotide biosynthesis protein B